MSEHAPWPPYFRSSIREHFHATGVLIANWQTVEDANHALFQILNSANVSFAFHAYDLLSNESRFKILRAELPRVIGDHYGSAIEHYLESAKIGLDNRNAIAHAALGPHNDPAFLKVRKGVDKTRTFIRQYTFSLRSLRRMADQTYITGIYGFQIFRHFTMAQASPPQGDAASWQAQIKQLEPWSNMPPLPERWETLSEPAKPE